jgi:hypothetical protein
LRRCSAHHNTRIPAPLHRMQRVQPTWAWARRLSIPIGSPRASEEGAGTWTRCCLGFLLSAFLASTLGTAVSSLRSDAAALPSDRLTYLCLCLCLSSARQCKWCDAASWRNAFENAVQIPAYLRRQQPPVPVTYLGTVYYSLALLALSPRHTPHVVQGATDATEATEEQQNHVGPLQKLSARLPHCRTA